MSKSSSDAESKPKKKSTGTYTSVDSLIIQSIIIQVKQIFASLVAGCTTRTLTQPFDVVKTRFQLQVEPTSFDALVYDTKRVGKYRSIPQSVHLIYKEEGIRAFWKGHNAGQLSSILYSFSQFYFYERFIVLFKESPLFAEKPALQHFLAGIFAGCVGATFVTPVDMVRTRLMGQDPGSGYRSMLQAFPEVAAKEGIRGLYRGYVPTLLHIVPMIGSNFFFYYKFGIILRAFIDTPDGKDPLWLPFVNGTLAGTTSKILLYPFDFLKRRLQMQGFEKSRQTFGENQKCIGLKGCIKKTLRKEGILGFYKGFSSAVLKSSVTNGSFFFFYFNLKSALIGN